MTIKYIIPTAVLLPLAVLVILALIGITASFPVYLLLGSVCLVVAGIIWFIYKDTEKKVSKARKP